MKKMDGATKIARYSIGKETFVFFRETLCHLTKNQRAAFLRTVEKFIRCIRECIFNTLKSSFHLNNVKKNRLSKYKTALCCIAAKRGNWKNKRKQRGGFLSYIIGPISLISLLRIIEGSKS